MRERLTNVENIQPLPHFDSDWQKNVPYSYDDLVIVIEYLAGDTRTKISNNGTVLEGVMPAAYGYILRTNDAHGEEIDMYLAPLAAMAGDDTKIYVIDQVNPGSCSFDEHKVMLCFSSIDDATHLYISVFGDGSGQARLGAITEFTSEAFITWLTKDGACLRPASFYKAEGVKTQEVSGVAVIDRGAPVDRDEAGGVAIELTDLSQGPKIKTVSKAEDSFDYHIYLYTALDIASWSNTVDTFCRILELADDRDTMHIHIASPGGAVLLMGRMISAINRTKAKVITHAEGCVASAATAIWGAGHERHIMPGAYFMQHMSSQLLAGKTTDIAAKSVFTMNYIEERLQYLISIGLFIEEEVIDMIEKSADVYISGREAIARMGQVSYRLV